MSVEVKGVSKKYGTQLALKEVSFEVKPGEIVGFLGPNGAGKSTMMKIIAGYLPQTTGEVTVCGKNIRQDEMETKRSIGYLPENNPLYADMFVKEYLTFSGGLYRVENLLKRVAEVVELVGLGKEQHKKIGELSKGYRQRVGLGQAFLHDPEVLILDEPTTGLDPNQIQEIRHLIQEIGKDKTVMLSTHIMQEVEAICDRAIIINDGVIVADHTITELKKTGGHSASLLVGFKETEGMDGFIQAFQESNIRILAEGHFELKTQDLSELKKKVISYAMDHNLEIVKLSEEIKSLENVFRDLTLNKKKGQ